MRPLSRKGNGDSPVSEPHKRTEPFSKDCADWATNRLGTTGSAMRVCRDLVFAPVLIAAPFAAHGQFGGTPGMPGSMPGAPGGFGSPPPQAGPPPACRE